MCKCSVVGRSNDRRSRGAFIASRSTSVEIDAGGAWSHSHSKHGRAQRVRGDKAATYRALSVVEVTARMHACISVACAGVAELDRAGVPVPDLL